MIITSTKPVIDVMSIQNKNETIREEEVKKDEEKTERIKANIEEERIKEESRRPEQRDEKAGKNIDITV